MAETELPSRPRHVLEDPTAKAIAQTYAEAFLDAAAAQGNTAALDELTSFVDDVLAPHPQFENLLTSHFVGRDERMGLIDRVVGPQASPLVTNFLRVLARHDRLDLVRLILDESWQEHERRMGKRRVQVRSAAPLSDDQLEHIRGRLAASLPYDPILQPEVDESLIGGLVLQVGDTVYDSSLRTRLRKLREGLRERYVNEIQSGRDRFSHSEGN